MSNRPDIIRAFATSMAF